MIESRVTVELVVASDRLTPEEVTIRLGLPYDRCWRIGGSRGRTGKTWATNGWVLELAKSVQRPEDAPTLLNECIEQFATRLTSIAEKVRELSREAEVGVSVDVLASGTPAITLKHEVLQTIAETGAWLDIDINIRAPSAEGSTS